MKKVLSAALAVLWMMGVLSGCGKKTAEPVSTTAGTTSPTSVTEPIKIQGDMFTQRDQETGYDESEAVTVTLNGTSATASSNSVKISGSRVTITEEATYVISGELTDGMLIVNAPDTAKLQLVFKGAHITSQTSAALYILEADKVFLTLADGTSNTLANGGSFTPIDDNNIDGALFSKQDLTINGTGALTVTSPVGHGIVGKDDLVIVGGNCVVNCASHGLDANDSVRIANANLTIDAGKDAIHAENDEDTSLGFVYIDSGTIRAEAEGDGITAGAYMQIVGGTIDLLVGGGSENGTKQHSDQFGGFMGRPGGNWQGNMPGNTTTTEEASTSMKGLKAEGSLVIADGDITINSADDAIHSNSTVSIQGGNFTIATGDDGIHAEETLTVTAGTIRISQCYEGLEALHIDVQGGDIKLKATDDGLNAAGGTDQSGTTGGRDGMFGNMGGGRPNGRPGGGPGGGGPGGMSANSNGSIKVSGGDLYINSSGDGMDANGTLEISGGHIVVVGPTQGDTATLDYDKTGIITGGTFIGTGASGMAQSFSDSQQGVIALNVGSAGAGTKIVLKDQAGNIILEHEPELNFAVVILSSPDIQKGETYTVTVGAQSGEFEAS